MPFNPDPLAAVLGRPSSVPGAGGQSGGYGTTTFQGQTLPTFTPAQWAQLTGGGNGQGNWSNPVAPGYSMNNLLTDAPGFGGEHPGAGVNTPVTNSTLIGPSSPGYQMDYSYQLDPATGNYVPVGAFNAKTGLSTMGKLIAAGTLAGAGGVIGAGILGAGGAAAAGGGAGAAGGGAGSIASGISGLGAGASGVASSLGDLAALGGVGTTYAIAPQGAAVTSPLSALGGGTAAGGSTLAGVGGTGAAGGVASLAGAGGAAGTDAASLAAADTSAGLIPAGSPGAATLAGAGTGVTGAAAAGGSSLLGSLGLTPAGALQAGSSLIGSIVSGNAAQNAAQIQADAANRATAQQKAMWDQVMANLAPYQQQGVTSLNQLGGYMNASPTGGPGGSAGLLHQFGAEDLNANMAPNYQFQLGQGLGQATNAATAMGGLVGGNALSGLNSYAQNTAANAYQNAFNNYTTNQNNAYGRLMNVAGLGQASATGAASGAPTFAGGIANTITGAGNAGAAGQIGLGNAISGGVNGIASGFLLSDLMKNQNPNSQYTLGG